MKHMTISQCVGNILKQIGLGHQTSCISHSIGNGMEK